MANWYKEKNFQFMLKDLNKTEDFTIWKAWDKRNEDVKDSQGQTIQFPVRKGQMMGEDGTMRELEDMKFMKKEDFTQQFPMLSKNTRYIREVLVKTGENFEEYTFGFCMSANRKLDEMIEMVQNLSQDPLKALFEQKYDANESPINKYSMKLINASAEMPKVVSPTTQDTSKVHSPKPDPMGMTDKEKEFISATRAVKAELELDKFQHIAKANGINSERAKVLFEKAYKA